MEKTAENQPSHGEDLGPDATDGQKEAFEMRQQDAEPDKVVIINENGESQEQSGEPAQQDDSAEQSEDVVVVSHDDAPAEDVAAAESAVVHDAEDAAPAEAENHPSTEHEDGPEAAEPETTQAESQVEESTETPVSEHVPADVQPEETQDDEQAVNVEHVEEAPAEEVPTDSSAEDAEFKADPLPASETATNPIDLQPGEEVPRDFGAEATNDDHVKLDQESFEQADASNEGVPEAEQFKVDPLPASETANNPVELQPGEEVPREIGAEATNDEHVKLDQESFENADASNAGLQETGDEEFKAEPLPASETANNPPAGEEPKDISAEAIDENVKLDQDSYEQADASNTGLGETGTEEFKVDPLPASESAVNPPEDQQIPEEEVKPEAIDENVKLDEASYEQADASNTGLTEAQGPQEDAEQKIEEPEAEVEGESRLYFSWKCAN